MEVDSEIYDRWEIVCSQTQLCHWGVFNDYMMEQLQVSTFFRLSWGTLRTSYMHARARGLISEPERNN